MEDLSSDLRGEMLAHLTEPFPASVERGESYGGVDAVMIDADVYGWASRAGSLADEERAGLLSAAAELEHSLMAFPPDARPYYERLLRIARLALAER